MTKLALLALLAFAPPEAEPTTETKMQAQADDGPVSVSTRIEPSPASIGDVLTYEVIAAYPRGYSVNLPTTLDLAPHHVVSIEASEPEPTGAGLRKVFSIELQAFAVGELSVPGFPLTYVTSEGAVQTVPVAPHRFEIAALLANETDPQRKGEDPPVSLIVPAVWAETTAYAAMATLLLAAMALLAWKRWRSKTRVDVGPPPLPPDRVALDALDELERGELLAQERYGDFYLQLTEILKGYLEGRFGLDALDRTTEEIRRSLVRRPDAVAPLRTHDVVDFLHRCDLVKFARFQPEPEEARSAVGAVRGLVEASPPPQSARPVEQPGQTDQEDTRA